MNNFKIIYKILKTIEKSMDYEEFDNNSISPEVLGISEQRWELFINELVEDGYIAGVVLVPIMGSRTKKVKLVKPYLTLKGMEFLEENSMMRKVADIAKGIADIVS